MSAPRVWVGPEPDERVTSAVARGGGTLVESADEADSIVWLAGRDPGGIRPYLHDGIRWVQAPSAGVERWLREGLVDGRRVWTGAQGAYAGHVSEHVLAFVLAAAKRLPQAARRTSWVEDEGRALEDATVGIVGAGGVGGAVIERLRPFGTRVLAQTRSGREITGAARSVGPDGLHELLRESDFAVLAAPLTQETRGLIGRPELELIGSEGWLVNVARGQLVQTDALVDALREGRLGGACLDVTDPEPLPDGHPLWSLDNVLVTPHVANPLELEPGLLAHRVEENVRRLAAGEDLAGRIDTTRGY